MAVDMDGAGAALRGVAPDLRPGEIEVVADHVDEQPPRLDLELDRPAVDREPDRNPCRRCCCRGRGGRSGRGLCCRPGRRRRDLAQAGTPTAATSSSALPMPSTIWSIWSSV